MIKTTYIVYVLSIAMCIMQQNAIASDCNSATIGKPCQCSNFLSLSSYPGECRFDFNYNSIAGYDHHCHCNVHHDGCTHVGQSCSTRNNQAGTCQWHDVMTHQPGLYCELPSHECNNFGLTLLHHDCLCPDSGDSGTCEYNWHWKLTLYCQCPIISSRSLARLGSYIIPPLMLGLSIYYWYVMHNEISTLSENQTLRQLLTHLYLTERYKPYHLDEIYAIMKQYVG